MPVVPFIPAIVGGVGAVAGGAMQAKSARDAASAQERAAMMQQESQERMFNKQLELMAPFREAGYGALEGLQGLVDPTQRAEMLSGYYNSPEYAQMADQASNSALRGASATGGLRSGSSHAALEQIAPQLGQNFLTNQYNQLTGLANLGSGAASSGVNAAGNYGNAMSNIYGGLGSAQAGNALAQGNAWSSGLQGLGNAFGQGWGVAQDKGYI